MSEPAPFLESYLADQDAPCPSCYYNLRGLKGDICPECSQQLVLRVGLAEPRMASFIAALLGLALGGGFSGMLLLYAIVSWGVKNARGGLFNEFLVATAPFAIVELGMLLVLVLCKRRFQRLGNGVKVLLVTIAWVLAMAGFVVFTKLIR